jgi:DNA primase catalytic subunit
MEEQKFKEVDEKCFEWGRKERKNIMNFFQKPKENKSVGGGSGGSSSSSRFFASTATTTTKGAKRTIGKAGAVKKPKSSFFSQQQTTNKTEAELVEDAIKASLEEA